MAAAVAVAADAAVAAVPKTVFFIQRWTAPLVSNRITVVT